MRCIILDLEATGLNPEKGDVIIDVAAVRVGPDGIEERFQTLVHPGDVAVSPFIEAMTGISSSMLEGAPAWNDVMPELQEFLGNKLPVLGHNVGFDANFLKVYGLTIAQDRLVDTCDFATIFFPKAPSHSLEVLSTYLGIEHTEKHSAMGDVLATYELLRCLIHQRDTAMDPATVSVVQTKAAGWNGLHFFTLETPGRDVTLPGPVAIDHNIQTLQTTGTLRVQLQPAAQRSVAWVVAQGNPVVLVPPSESETMRDLVLAQEIGTFLDNASNYLHPDAVRKLLSLETWSTDIALFCFRIMLFAKPGMFVHQTALAITHKERELFALYGAEDADISNIVSQAEGPLFVTYAAWHKYKEYLPQNLLWVIPDAMRMELYLHQSSKSYLSLDATVGRLKNLAARCEAEGLSASDLLESLEYVARYAFSGLSKLLRHDQRELVLEEVPDLLRQFSETWTKGLQQWKNRLSMHPALEKQRQYLEEMVEGFIQRVTDPKFVTTVCRMNQGILLQQEVRSLQEERAWFEALASCQLLHGYMDERFPLFLEAKESVVVDALDLQGVTFQKERSSLLAEEFAALPLAAAQAVLAQGAQHTLFCTGSGTVLDKAFDQLFDGLHNDTFTVLSSGKTGGKGKVRYNFVHNAATLLVATAQDAKGMGVRADTVVLTSLPFPAVMSAYWSKNYGDNTFGTLTMPLMTQQVVDLVWATQSEQKTQLYISDARLFEKKYGQELIQSLGSLMQII